MDTIYALSSGALPSGVAVIRVSGPDAGHVVEATAGRLPNPRQATLCSIRSRNGSAIDRGLVFWFPGSASFTGEASAEFHLHGGRAVVDRMLDELAGFPGLRMAEAGEFSRRAFVNGKLDLTEAEGLADLIAAETEAQRVLALSQASGALKAIYDGWQQRLLHARAMIEAEIDFSDEEDVPGSVADQVWADMRDLLSAMEEHIAGAGRANAVREGFRIVIVGAPNAGKSSLMNALAGSEVAIVSDEPGTTRDIVETRLVIGGRLVLVADTAGIRETENAIEAEGVRRALVRAGDADLVLHLSDTGSWDDLSVPSGVPVWQILSKADLRERNSTAGLVTVSSKAEGGLESLFDSLLKHLDETIGRDLASLPTRQRHLDQLRRAVREIELSLDGFDAPLELRAEHLRAAGFNLGSITGQHTVEDILGVIFSEFCIGK
ncbi:tRNA uridine-5-carboxymethylaminomethyl(34) synthesis GTPase MnmE [Oricola sp.]|uniref:tRNA uridine-5-carboxymethylaminomethyl(34) synthesis GTPase MnmE n=1 Tax=Oricola sp. TaxID=1979950 RepID=UPI0025FCABCA|nr:tRNA uridine-5-carboxymethylaminomethyl(34) synthesis GTPase MnmE [Oricola sp.]MCI5077520.1 tRNA uridine-5-carboxymethylaminomethyl(34) synthesis GTPase MnmE [Oricola sp.]